MSFEITGKLIVKNDIQQINESFRKREFVLELTDQVGERQFINYAKMQLVQNKCEIIDAFQVGDYIKVNFNIKGNRWEKEGRENYITNLDAWRIESANPIDPYAQGGGASSGYSAPAPQQDGGAPKPEPAAGSEGEAGAEPEDDLPF